MKQEKAPAPFWFVLLAIGVILTILGCSFGTTVWAVIKIVNHFT